MVRILVRAVRTGTTLQRTRTTTFRAVASVSAQLFRSVNATAWQADHIQCGQPLLSSYGKYFTWFDITLSRRSNSGVDIFMPKKHKDLINEIISMENLRLAYKKTSKNKKLTYGYLEFKEFDQANLLIIQKELQNKAYKIGDYRQFFIYEPKQRLISALDFKDRLVQHAVCNIISPIFEKTLLPYTFACRDNLGTHAGVIHIQKTLRKTNARYFLKTDFAKFFPNIDHKILHQIIDCKISCEQTLRIIREIIPTDSTGIPIGSLTSQLFANVYGGMMDDYLHHTLKQRHWARYMDDIVILGDNRQKLLEVFKSMANFAQLKMNMKISKWTIGSVKQGINFLGFRIWKTHKLLRRDSVIKAKRKVAKFIKLNDLQSLHKFLAAWRGHAQWANAHNLFKWMEKKYDIII